MEKISTGTTTSASKVEELVLTGNELKNKIKKSFFNYAGIFIGIFLMFAVVVIVTTDISFASFEEVKALGLDFFLLFFCSYSMYVNCSDSGMRNGLTSKTYFDATNKFEELKQKILSNDLQAFLPSFCKHYIENELRTSRLEVLGVVGITYEEYLSKYVTLGTEDIDKLEGISESQKKAIKQANRIKPIKLTPEMIMKQGRGSSRRSPLSISPKTKKAFVFTYKIVTMLLVSLMVILVIIKNGDKTFWEVFTACIIRLLTVIMNGFSGYKFGYENIVFDTVNFMTDQTDLMRQMIHFAETKTE
jgi:hypothetical protein